MEKRATYIDRVDKYQAGYQAGYIASIAQQKNNKRKKERKLFLEKLLEIGKIQLEQPFLEKIIPLPSDASTRRYFRILQPQKNLLLMDAPPEVEKPNEFIQVAKYLQYIGLRAPQVYHADLEKGFLLIEDFGNDSFSKLLDAGCEPRELYQDAIAVLLHILHSRNKQAQESIPQPPDDAAFWGAELEVFCDYYYPALLGENHALSEQQAEKNTRLVEARNNDAKNEWRECWQSIFANLPSLPQVLVLRDCHVDNLIRIPEEALAESSPLSRCGLLDFQDAVFGSPAYDLVSLLEDARRDLKPELRKLLLEHYLASARQCCKPEDFCLHYKVWAAQRHARVLGTFARLALRDHKQALSRHMPRVLRLLNNALSQDAKDTDSQQILKPLAKWFDTYLPEHEAKLARCLHNGSFRIAN